jgi:anti-anti-sigma factor
MAVSCSKLRVCQHSLGIVFQMADKATMQHAPTLRALAERALVIGAGYVHIDLRRCDYMDSTFIGTLLFLNKAAARLEPGGFAVVSPSESCRKLIQKMGLAAYFPMIEDAELPPASWAEISTDDDPAAFKRCVVHAHQELAEVPGPTGATFQCVAQAMTKELEGDSARGET